jgi:YfiH family protein
MRLFEWNGAPPGYRVAFSTREGGVSEGSFRSLNLGLLTADEPANVLENRRRLCAAIGADADQGTMAYQVHGARVVEAEPLGLAAPGTRYPACDGLVTGRAGLALMLVAADCVPVALARTSGRRRLAVLHVGWRGLLAGIVAEGVKALDGGGAAAAVGPGIGQCCYDVGDEVAAPFLARFGGEVVSGGRLDLPAAVELALREAGVDAVERNGHCTACEPELLFSHRRDRGCTGRQGVVAALA